MTNITERLMTKNETMEPFFSRNQVKQWRILSQLDDWEITSKVSAESRELLAKLNPPFIPDGEEPLVFWTRILGTLPVFAPSISIKYVRCGDKQIGLGGVVRATDRRFIIMDKSSETVVVVPYKYIKSFYAERDDYNLVLSDGTNLRIAMKVPHPSLLGTLAFLGGSPMDKVVISHMEQNKAEVGQNFTALFSGFFLDIVEKNQGRE